MGLKEKFQVLSKTKMLFAGLMIVVFYYFALFDDGAPKQAELQGIQKEAAEIQSTLDENKRFLQDRASFEKELARLNDQYKQVLEYLPPNFNTQDLLRKLSTEAKIAGVSLIAVKALPPEPRTNPQPINPNLPAGSAQAPVVPAFYEEVKMDVELEGTYAQLMTFLSGVSRLQRLVNIQNVDMSIRGIGDGAAIVSLKSVLISYRATGT